jgi:hypothetical protein
MLAEHCRNSCAAKSRDLSKPDVIIAVDAGQALSLKRSSTTLDRFSPVYSGVNIR